MRRPPLRAALPLGLVALVAGAAVLSSATGRDGELAAAPPLPPDTSAEAATTVDPLGSLTDLPPGVEEPPPPAAGRYRGFVLGVVARSCELAGWNLARGEPTGSSGRACAFALAPAAGWVVLTNDAGGSLAGATLDRIGFDGQEYDRDLVEAGPASLGDVAIADDGTLATCTAAGGAARTIVIGPGRGRREVDGCSPVALGDRILLARSAGAAIVVDAAGATVVPRAAVSPPPIGTAVIGVSQDGLLGIAARRAPGVISIDVRRLPGATGGPPATLAPLPLPARDPTALRLAPGGRAGAFREVGSRGWTLVSWTGAGDVPATLATIDGYGPILDVDFAADGEDAVVATPRATLIVELRSLVPVATVPIEGGASTVAWLDQGR